MLIEKGSRIGWSTRTIKRSLSNEWDNWDAKTVGLSDSVSLVAEGKERRRMDQWQTMCELLGLEICLMLRELL